MAVEAVVALMVEKLDKLLTKEAQLLGVHGEIKLIRQELNQMRRFLKDADIKQKENEDVRDWMEDVRDICFDVDDVIDILGQGQAGQGRHGFVERLKGRISDQITRYKVGKEIERIKLNIKGISRRRESYRITETSSTQRLQEVSRCSVPPEKMEKVNSRVDDQLTRDIDEGRLEAQAAGQFSTRLGESEEVGLQEEINRVSEQLTKEEPSHCDGTRDIDEGRLEASSSAPCLQADRQLSTLLGESEEVGLQEGINTVGQQLMEEELGSYDGTRDFDEGILEDLWFRNQARAREEEARAREEEARKEKLYLDVLGDRTMARPPSTALGSQTEARAREKEARREKLYLDVLGDLGSQRKHNNATWPELGTGFWPHFAPRLQELSRRSATPEKIEKAITRVHDQLTNEERTTDSDEGRQEPSSSSRNLQAHRPVSTLPGEPEEVGLQEEISTVGQQLIEEEPRLWDGTRDISEGSTLLGHSDVVGLQEEINTVDQQLIKEKPSHCDDTSGIDEVPEYRDGSKRRKLQPMWSERVRVSSGRSLEDPPDDGHCWRKYGQKDILKDKYPRAYYKCADKDKYDRGCSAKKQVQRSDEDPSIFCIVYRGLHTCTAPLYLEKGTIEEVQAEQPDGLQAEQPDNLRDCTTVDDI